MFPLYAKEDTPPPADIIESVVGGAHVYLVNGLISDCGKLVKQGCERFGWFDLSTLKEPFASKARRRWVTELAFDLAEVDGSDSLKLPDVIFYYRRRHRSHRHVESVRRDETTRLDRQRTSSNGRRPGRGLLARREGLPRRSRSRRPVPECTDGRFRASRPQSATS
ncbi:MAG: hypothetical protein R3C02_06475 [Planctomycetaceae bacterium]